MFIALPLAVLLQVFLQVLLQVFVQVFLRHRHPNRPPLRPLAPPGPLLCRLPSADFFLALLTSRLISGQVPSNPSRSRRPPSLAHPPYRPLQLLDLAPLLFLWLVPILVGLILNQGGGILTARGTSEQGSA